MAQNFTVQDVQGILLAFPWFSLILVAPGYLLGLVSNVFDFRRRGLSERVLLALAISIAVSPFAINFLCRFFPVWIVSALYFLIGIAFLARLLFEWRRRGYAFRTGMHWTTKAALCMVGVWIVICFLSLPDLQSGQRIYSNAATWDYSVRSPLIASALRTGAPQQIHSSFPDNLFQHAITTTGTYYVRYRHSCRGATRGSCFTPAAYGVACFWLQ